MVVSLKKTCRNPAIIIMCWSVMVFVHAAYHVRSALASPTPDLYANTVGFQVLSFMVVWLPAWFVGLVVVLWTDMKHSKYC